MAGILAAGLTSPVAVATTPPRTSAADAAVRQAADAWRARKAAKLDPLLAATRGHVLAPWVEYWQLSLRLESAGPEAVHAYLGRYPGSLAADRLQADWLRLLGRREQWAELRAEAATGQPDEPDIACLVLHAGLQAGQSVAPASLEAILAPARLLPEPCANLASALVRQGALPAPLARARVRRLLDAGSLPALLQALAWVPEPERPATHALTLAWNHPAKAIAEGGSGAPTPSGSTALALAWTRLIRSDMHQAADRLDGAHQARLLPDDLAFVATRLGLALARSHQSAARAWFDLARGQGLDEEAWAWAARAALRDEAWGAVRDTITRMPPALAAEPTWVYWQARAQRALGEPEAAQASLARIADRHDFYGTLAAEDLGRALPPQPTPGAPSAAELAAARQNPAIARAVAFLQLGLRMDGVREWNWALRGMSDAQLLATAEHARSLGLWDRAINTAERTQVAHDFGLRYLAPYRAVFAEQARERSLIEGWVLGVARQESRFVADIRSSAGAVGLMQLMPATAKLVARQVGLVSPDLTDVRTNVVLGTSYLRQVLDRLDGQPLLASAGYNAGPGRAQRWRAERPLEGAIYAETIPFNETRDYVKRVLANAVWYAQVLGHTPLSLRQLLATVPPRADVKAEPRGEPGSGQQPGG